MEQNTSSPIVAESDRFLPISILVAALLVSGSLIYTMGPSTQDPKDVTGTDTTDTKKNNVNSKVSDTLPRDVVLGEANAPITFIEYGDYQCPFCARFFTQSEAVIRETYIKTGKVKMIYRDFAFLGPESIEAAEAAECAKDQGKFWGYHDALYAAEGKDGVEHNGNLERGLFVKIAKDLGMDVAKFTECYDKDTYKANVIASRENGNAVGVRGTPATFVNGEEVEGGAQPYATYQAMFDAILKQ